MWWWLWDSPLLSATGNMISSFVAISAIKKISEGPQWLRRLFGPMIYMSRLAMVGNGWPGKSTRRIFQHPWIFKGKFSANKGQYILGISWEYISNKLNNNTKMQCLRIGESMSIGVSFCFTGNIWLRLGCGLHGVQHQIGWSIRFLLGICDLQTVVVFHMLVGGLVAINFIFPEILGC